MGGVGGGEERRSGGEGGAVVTGESEEEEEEETEGEGGEGTPSQGGYSSEVWEIVSVSKIVVGGDGGEDEESICQYFIWRMM